MNGNNDLYSVTFKFLRSLNEVMCVVLNSKILELKDE